MERLQKILDYTLLSLSDSIHISVKKLLFVIFIFGVSYVLLKIIKKIVYRKLTEEDKPKFSTVFNYINIVIYTLVLLIVFDSLGVEITGILAASAALLVGIGLALQTFFQDIISGIVILFDQTLHVGDIIEIDGKTAKVTEIKLRTTRARTLDNKVIIIPNHKYLVNNLYNWTENNKNTREFVTVSVAYGSDLELVKKLLIQIANNHPLVHKNPTPIVVFTNFGNSSLDFKIIFTVRGALEVEFIKSDIRFEIDKKFNENNIEMPFYRREVYIRNKF